MEKDIIDRLRDQQFDCAEEAADEIEWLRAQVKGLEMRVDRLRNPDPLVDRLTEGID